MTNSCLLVWYRCKADGDIVPFSDGVGDSWVVLNIFFSFDTGAVIVVLGISSSSLGFLDRVEDDDDDAVEGLVLPVGLEVNRNISS